MCFLLIFALPPKQYFSIEELHQQPDEIDNDSAAKRVSFHDVISIIFMDISGKYKKTAETPSTKPPSAMTTTMMMQGVKFLSFINLLKLTRLDLGWRKSHLMAERWWWYDKVEMFMCVRKMWKLCSADEDQDPPLSGKFQGRITIFTFKLLTIHRSSSCSQSSTVETSNLMWIGSASAHLHHKIAHNEH